jgi:GNAT superfamily N-acetyltransferase
MKVTYSVERMQDSWRAMVQLLPVHWEEVARDRDVIKLDPDWAQYFAMEDAGGVHMVVARHEGRMIGYAVYFVRPHLHYRKSLSAICDVYFILPEFRRGRVGIEFFRYAEATLKAKGVQKIFTGTKVRTAAGTRGDKSAIFEHLGYSLTEKLYTKVIQ